MLITPQLEKILYEYRQSLVIPPNKRKGRQLILCPVGLVGSGKTTVIKPLSEKLTSIRISTDEIRKLLKENNLSYDPVYEMSDRLTEEYLKEGYSVAIDADCGNPERRKFIEELSDRYQIEVFWIHVNPPEEFILNKLKEHSPTWLSSNPEKMIENYFRQKKTRMENNQKFNFLCTIDTSRDSLAEQINVCRRRIEKITQSKRPG